MKQVRTLLEPPGLSSMPELRIVTAHWDTGFRGFSTTRVAHYILALFPSGHGFFGPEPAADWPIEPPCLVVIPPNWAHRLQSTGKGGIVCRIVIVGGKRVEEWVAAGWLPREPARVKLARPARFMAAHRDLLRALEMRDRRRLDLAKNTLERALIEIGGVFGPDVRAQDSLEHRFWRVVHGWRRDPAVDADCSRIARAMGMSEVQFRRHFRRLYGAPPHRYLIQLRLERAEALLRGGVHTIKETAFASGFGSEDAFRRAFRRRHGAAPSVLRG